MPSFRGSPWIRGAPQEGFSRHILLIRSRTSREMTGRPSWPCRTFQAQKRRKPLRCQAENLALRQQLVALKRRHPRPSLGLLDKLFWVIARRVWSGWKQALLVTPETVVRWHRAGFRMYWRLISRVQRQVGRKQTPKEIRELIFQMVTENPTWGAPRIHGELRMLGLSFPREPSPVG